MEPARQFTAPLFHGARHSVEGDKILPPSQTGVPALNSVGFSGDTKGPHVENAFATPDEDLAWKYARGRVIQTSYAALAPNPARESPDPKYMPRVYKVEPLSDDVVPSETLGTREVASRTGFRITGSEDAPVGETRPIPGVNWEYKGYDAALGRNRRPSAKEAPKENTSVVSDGQLNLFSGRTAGEHRTFEHTPDMLLSSQHSSKDISDFRRDPMSDYAQRNSEINKRLYNILNERSK